jgi:hypothetical protein
MRPTQRRGRSAGNPPKQECATEPIPASIEALHVNLPQQESVMNWYEEPATPVPEPTTSTSTPTPTSGGWRRGIATLALAAGLVLVGGAAVVSAASPDPSASPAPSATTQPANPGSSGGTHTGKNCPNMGGSGGSGSQTPNASPDASPDASSSNT